MGLISLKQLGASFDFLALNLVLQLRNRGAGSVGHGAGSMEHGVP